MAAEKGQNKEEGMFSGMTFYLVAKGVQPKRLQIWREKLVQMGAAIEDHLSKKVMHILAKNQQTLVEQVGLRHLRHFKGKLLLYQWLEECLKRGEKASDDSYFINLENVKTYHPTDKKLDPTKEDVSNDQESKSSKKIKVRNEDSKGSSAIMNKDTWITAEFSGGNVALERQVDKVHQPLEKPKIGTDSSNSLLLQSNSEAAYTSTGEAHLTNKELSSAYKPPDLNKNITEIFGRLINIYRALGDDRRSFSYYKAIPVIEQLPFKIESGDQVKHLPAIGKSLQDHVRTITLLGEVWGIGPATALKLYEKGHRTLEDLRGDDSLTSAQRIGLKYFDDIKKRIPRQEVRDMEILLQRAGEDVLPGVVIICGGSFRRGKSSCGDLDVVVTHPDGESHKGFLSRFVKHLKDMQFLREDLVFSTHSTEGTDSGVDTYFGLCTYPGQEQRHRIDLKVYPRDIYAFGLIAWTGNDVLNRRLRLLADSKGYRLDDTGLFLVAHGSSGKKVRDFDGIQYSMYFFLVISTASMVYFFFFSSPLRLLKPVRV
ncbi:hypothetical protein AMTRI_Chr10g5890 [Amborella trichopoda]